MTITEVLNIGCMTPDMLIGYVRGFMRTMPEGTIMSLPIEGIEGIVLCDAFYGLKLGPVSYRYADNEAELEKTRMLYNVEPPATASALNNAKAAKAAITALNHTSASIAGNLIVSGVLHPRPQIIE